MSKITSAAMLCVLAFASSASAHDHAKHHSTFYKDLMQPGSNVSCCNDRDCRPVKHRVTPTGIVLEVGGKWITPPESQTIETDTPDAGAHWCGVGEQYAEPITFCAIVPRGGV